MMKSKKSPQDSSDFFLEGDNKSKTQKVSEAVGCSVYKDNNFNSFISQG